jgi:hypothetical protein
LTEYRFLLSRSYSQIRVTGSDMSAVGGTFRLTSLKPPAPEDKENKSQSYNCPHFTVYGLHYGLERRFHSKENKIEIF